MKVRSVVRNSVFARAFGKVRRIHVTAKFVYFEGAAAKKSSKTRENYTNPRKFLEFLTILTAERGIYPVHVFQLLSNLGHELTKNPHKF